MSWLWAMFAPLLCVALLRVWGPAAVQAGYHVLCLGATVTYWKRIRERLVWTPECGPLSLLLSLLIVAGIVVPALIWDPRVLRERLTPLLFPHGFQSGLFVAAAFTVLVHTPLEEFYWRGLTLDEESPVRTTLWGSVFWFYWLHAAPLSLILGVRGLWLALPTAPGGALWAWSVLRTKSLWPALISHWAAEAVLLFGALKYLRP